MRALLSRSVRLSLLALAMPMLASARAPGEEGWDGTQWAQLTIHERVIIRIPRVAAPPRADPAAPAAVPRPAPSRWVEKRAPRCISAASLTGATVGAQGDLDLIVDGETRLRAKLGEECRPMDFYSGFYLKPASDGRICARRDMIRSRSGAHCAITQFRKLVASR